MGKGAIVRDVLTMVVLTHAFMVSMYVFVCSVLPAALVVQFIAPSLGLVVIDTLASVFFTFMVGLFNIILGAKVTIFGDVEKLRRESSRIIIMNHRTRFDWLFAYCLQSRFGSIGRFKLFVKRQIGHIPGLGWAMQATRYVFLRRSWTKDQHWIQTLLIHFHSLNYKPHFLFFPEGTYLRPASQKSTENYAKKNDINIPSYKYVLYPKTRGFCYLVEQLRHLDMLEQVVDVTLLFPEHIVERKLDIVFRPVPSKVLIHVQVFEKEDIPSGNDEAVKDWLLNRWAVKEKLLKDFYENGKEFGLDRVSVIERGL